MTAINIVFGRRKDGKASSSVYEIALRRGNTEQWKNFNPTLWENEVGIDKDLDRIKIGDGVHSWNDLPYATPERALSLLVNAR